MREARIETARTEEHLGHFRHPTGVPTTHFLIELARLVERLVHVPHLARVPCELLVEGYGGNPAVIGAVGMLAGFCGTLLTPMAANFNIVPAALLELDDQNGVIRQQVWTAIPLWVCNVAIIYIGAFLLWN